MRYMNQKVFENKVESYKRYLKSRGLQQIHQFNTPKFKYPSDNDAKNISTINHIWSGGDRYFKLAYKYYGDPEFWWVIAFYNQKPTEFHLNFGDVVYIPTPLETILFNIGY